MRLTIYAMICGFCILASGAIFAGSLDSPSAPGATSGYTIDDIWNRLINGTAGSPSTFKEPLAAPGSTGHTLDEVMGKLPVPDNTNGAMPSDVANGKTFWGLKTGTTAWGQKIGTGSITTAPAPVPKTGQTSCWDASGASISCSGTGQDGDLKKGVASPSPRFKDNSDGTVTDNRTGLMWMKNANAIGTLYSTFDIDGAAEGGITWQHALDFVKAVNIGTYSCGVLTAYSDWRLPTVTELQSLVNYAYNSPALSNDLETGQWVSNKPFLNVQSAGYWSATTCVQSPSQAWYVSMVYGNVSFVGKSTIPSAPATPPYVWLVRGGQ